jgi:hypothetical protein
VRDDDPAPACITWACQQRLTGPRRPLDGLRVCRRCADTYRDQLVEIPTLWAQLPTGDDWLVPVRDDQPPRSAPGPARAAPIDLTLAAITDPRTEWIEPGDLIAPATTLTKWAEYVHEQVGARGLASVYYVAGACGYLGRWSEWTLRQDWTAGLVLAVAEVHRVLRAVTPGPGRSPVGVCPGPAVGTGCGARLWAPAVGDTVRCRRCGTSWSREELLAQATADRVQLVDTEAIAVRYGVATGTIRRWAHEDRWPAHGTRRHRLWSLADAQAAYDRRHPTDIEEHAL